MKTESAFAYDRIIYPSYLHAQTHPDRLAVMARFFGMSPAPVDKCRVLELGCGTGSTLLSFALGLPDCEFVGVDLGEKQIELGKWMQRSIGLPNLQLIHRDLMDVRRTEFGEFDYIIAHGVYSWVPAPVRERVLQICGEMLAPQGVGFISFNAYPGGHIRQMTREIMRYHTRDIIEPAEKVNQAIAVLKFAAEGASQEKLYQKIYESELAVVLDRNPENVFHDDLAEINQPFYLFEFIAALAATGLKYISDVQYFSTKDLAYPPTILDALNSMGDNVEMREQYLDFLNCRRFRQALLCHEEAALDRQPRNEMLDEIRLATHTRPVSSEPELASKKKEEFCGPKTQNIEIDHPLTKAVLCYLGGIWPRSATLHEAKTAAIELLSRETDLKAELTPSDEAILGEILMRIFGSGLLQFRTIEPRYAGHAGERPTVSPLARWQAARGETVFNLRYESLNVEDPLGLKLISIADGSLDRDGIREALLAFVFSDELDTDDTTREKLADEIRQDLDTKLADLADHGLVMP